MRSTSSKLLQIQGRWHREGQPKKKIQNLRPKNSKNYSTPWIGHPVERRAKHKFAPQVVRDILSSERLQYALGHYLRFGTECQSQTETTKMLRSNSGSLTLCYIMLYTLRRLSDGIQEPYPTLFLSLCRPPMRQFDRGKANPLHERQP